MMEITYQFIYNGCFANSEQVKTINNRYKNLEYLCDAAITDVTLKYGKADVIFAPIFNGRRLPPNLYYKAILRILLQKFK